MTEDARIPTHRRSPTCAREIDRIDEAMHALLMERGEIIDRLIAVKQTQESGSAFRPAREADMMRRLVERHQRHPAARHRREHLARHHRDLHLCAGAVLGACRPLGRRRRDARLRALPFRLHGAVRAAYGRGQRGRGGVGIQGRSRPGAGVRAWPAPAPGGPRSNSTPRRRSSRGCRSSSAPTIRPRCRCSWSRAPRADAMVTRGRGLERAGRRLERRRPPTRSRRSPRWSRCRTAPSTARRCWSRCRRAARSAEVTDALVKAGASVRATALVGSHATRYRVPAERLSGPSTDRPTEIHWRRSK